MTSNEHVLRVLEVLHRLNISNMLVGSYSSNAYGIARSTHDADFVIELGEISPTELFRQLDPVLKFDPQMQFESVTMTGRYIGRSVSSSFKVQLFLIADDPFDRERFDRRERQPFLTTEAYLPTPEDVIVQKLRWFGRARRTKDIDDAKNVFNVQLGKLDLVYIRRWCDEHGTLVEFERLLEESNRFQ